MTRIGSQQFQVRMQWKQTFWIGVIPLMTSTEHKFRSASSWCFMMLLVNPRFMCKRICASKWETNNKRGNKSEHWFMLTASIYIYNCPFYLVAENTKQELGKEKKINSKNCFASVMPPDQHNNTPRDDIKPWSLLLEGFAESSCPSAPKLHHYNLNCHTLNRTHEAYAVLIWVTGPQQAQCYKYIGRVRHRWRWLL